MMNNNFWLDVMDFINIVILAWVSVPLKMPGLRKAFLRTQSFIQTQLISKLIALLFFFFSKKKRFGVTCCLILCVGRPE